MSAFVQVDAGELGQGMAEAQSDQHPILQCGAEFALALLERGTESGDASQLRNFPGKRASSSLS